MVQAIQLGGKVEPEAIRQGLEKVGYFHKNMGPIHFDDHHQAHTWMVLTTMKDCKVQLLKIVYRESLKWCRTPPTRKPRKKPQTVVA